MMSDVTRGYLWTDRDIKGWAKKYLMKRTTLESLEDKIGVSHSTLWWCFVNRLEYIDVDLYDRVSTKLEDNKHLRNRGGIR